MAHLAEGLRRRLSTRDDALILGVHEQGNALYIIRYNVRSKVQYGKNCSAEQDSVGFLLPLRGS